MNILEEIAERTRERVAAEKRARSLASVRRAAEERAAAEQAAGEATASERDGSAAGAATLSVGGLNAGGPLPASTLVDSRSERVAAHHQPFAFPFEAALAQPDISFICEAKRASPSKGLIAPDFPYVQIAQEYEAAGAAAISCLTEPYWFQGRDEYLAEIAQAVRIPVLRKDFVVDEHMVYGAKVLGASAVLLICAILDDAQLLAYRELADELGLSVLVEAHSAEEVKRALAAGARVVGVNNRDLRTFTVDLDTSRALRELVPPEVLFVSESGIHSSADVERLRAQSTDAVLVGEALMRATDKRAALDALRGVRS